jgi:hypothetical protein
MTGTRISRNRQNHIAEEVNRYGFAKTGMRYSDKPQNMQKEFYGIAGFANNILS